MGLSHSRGRSGRFNPLTEVTAVAPAKINLYFQVGKKREDGYHDVLSLYCAVSLYDEVKIVRRRDEETTVRVRGDSLGDSAAEIPLNEDNLAVKAAQLLAESSDRACGVDIEIRKNIPVAGGMAGGSADAAATLVACNALWGGQHSLRGLERFGAQLGADVPFCLRGFASIGTGTGTRLDPVAVEEPLWWVVVPARFGLSTAEVFGYFSRTRNFTAKNSGAGELRLPPGLTAALQRADPEGAAPYFHNDLQQAAITLSAGADGRGAPDLGRTLARGMESGALAALISGSGPSVVLLASGTDAAGARGCGENNARRIARYVDAARGSDAPHCVIVRGPVAGARVVAAVPDDRRRTPRKEAPSVIC